MEKYCYIEIKNEFELEMMSKVLFNRKIKFFIENGNKFTIVANCTKKKLESIHQDYSTMINPVYYGE